MSKIHSGFFDIQAAPIFPVILCGGSGTRLWPVSRKATPKQFGKLIGRESLFQSAARRVSGGAFEAPVVVTGDPFRFTIVEQLADIETAAGAILIEPEGRNTAPAVLAAALWIRAQSPSALMLVMPADHQIPDSRAFQLAVRAAAPRALAGDLITFGILPTHAETGYGYLELAPGARTTADQPQPLNRFVEKPDAARAAEMVASGQYLWNAGIFLFSVDAIIAAFARHAPEMRTAVAASVAAAKPDLSFVRLDPKAWQDVASISIDYAIMEKAENLSVMPFAAGWSDLGVWASVMQESAADANGNVCSANTTALGCTNSLLKAEGAGLHLVGIGLEGMMAVATPDAILVAPLSESQRVGEAVAELRRKGIKQADISARDQRPWGWFESLAVGSSFQVKHIVVRPGQALSLQSHNHRAEHWIVVAGTAKVTIGDQISEVGANQSVYVPLGAIHRLENLGDVPVEMIEVQTGAYLGEDDIVRYEDRYART